MINESQVKHSLKNPDEKRELNKSLFTIISKRYDLITQLLSFGCDNGWKKAMVKKLPQLAAPTCLDLACGTGDLCTLLALRYPKGHITGIDITPAMLALAKKNNISRQVEFAQADMAAPPVSDFSIDIVTGGYALRNAPDLDQLLTSVWQKLKPGGVASFLDFSKSDKPWVQWWQLRLLKIWTGFFGLILHGNPVIYSYIAASLNTFPTQKALQAKLESMGFKDYACTYHHLGFVSHISFIKPVHTA